MRTRAEHPVVHRHAELQRLNDLLRPDSGARWLHVSGIGGVGKSTLIRHWASGLAPLRVVALDGAFLPADPALLQSHPPADVLIIDSFERIQVLEGRIGADLMPSLPDGSRIVTAGRQPLSPGLALLPEVGHRIAELRLSGFTEPEAEALLDALSVPAARRDEIQQLAAGHPLVLAMAARLVAELPTMPLELGRHPQTVRYLVQTLLDHAPTAAHRKALEVLAFHHATTEEIVRQLIDDPAAPELFDWLCDQSFTHLTPFGITPHAVPRRLLVEEALWRDPAGFPRRVLAAQNAAIERIERGPTAPPFELANWSLLVGLNHIGPTFIDARADCFSDRLRPADRDPILRMAARHYGPESAAIAAFWLDRAPHDVIVGRLDSGQPLAFVQFLERHHLDVEAVAVDPAAAAFHELIAQRCVDGDRAVMCRFMLTEKAPLLPDNPGFSFAVREQTAHLTQLRSPRLSVSADESRHLERLSQFAVHPVHDEVTIDGVRFVITYEDYGEVRATDWMRRLGGSIDPPGLPPSREPSTDSFADEVRAALRALHRTDRLAKVALIERNVGRGAVAGVGDHEVARAEAMRKMLEGVLDALGDGETDTLQRALLTATYFSPPRKQRALAADFAMGYSTFRRHLGDAVERFIAVLRERELSAAPPRERE